MLQFFKKLKLYLHKISSRNSTRSITIEIYFQSALSPSSNEVFFRLICKINNFISKCHWYIIICQTCFALLFLVIAIVDGALFCGDFNSSSCLYSNAINKLIPLWACGTFPVCTLMKLRHKSYIEIVKSWIPQSNLLGENDHATTLRFFLFRVSLILCQLCFFCIAWRTFWDR